MALIARICVLIYLLFVGIVDCKKKEIEIWQMVLGIVPVILLVSFNVEDDWLELLFGFAIGIIIVIISFVSGGQIGIADGIIIAEIGLGVGLSGIVILVCIALFLIFCVSIFLMLFHRINKKSKIPFIPFVWISYLICVLGGM